MTAILPEPTAVVAETLADLSDAAPELRAAIGMGLVRALHLVPRDPDPEFVESVALGFTEDLAAFDARLRGESRG